MGVSLGGLFGLTVAIFEFPPQSPVMGQNVVVFQFFLWNMTVRCLNYTKSPIEPLDIDFMNVFRVIEVQWTFF